MAQAASTSSAAASAVKKRIVVAGGNGFLGSRICKSAVARGWDVTSISRSGEPTWSSVTSSSEAPSWSKAVRWVKADILKPASYRKELVVEDSGAGVDGKGKVDAVVHTMGILLEADYKGVLTGKESVWGGLSRAFSARKEGSAKNPMERGPVEEEDGIGVGEKDGQITYELMNRDSAVSLAKEAQDAGVGSFVYISAAAGAPILPKRYITTKREAESIISSQLVKLRNIFIRPGFLYDSSRKFTLPIMAAGMVGSTVNAGVGGWLTNIVGAAVEKPLKADAVADAVVEAIEDEAVNGVQTTKEIEALAHKAWRREML